MTIHTVTLSGEQHCKGDQEYGKNNKKIKQPEKKTVSQIVFHFRAVYQFNLVIYLNENLRKFSVGVLKHGPGILNILLI